MPQTCSAMDDFDYQDEEREDCDYEEGEDCDYEEEEEDDGYDYDAACSDDEATVSSNVPNSQVITKESLLLAQREDLSKVMDMLQLNEQHARTLLIHHRWDVQKVLTVLVEKGKDQLKAEAGVTILDRYKEASLSSSCYICMEDGIALDEVTAMDCGHCFCNNCWTEHFIVKINDGQSKRIMCMAHKCNAICDEVVVRDLVSARDPGLAERFERFLMESYIDDNKSVKWCPSVPHCGYAIRVVDGHNNCEVECACGHQFCFGCSSEAHSPCSCLMWDLWKKKGQNDSETANWLTAHTKLCPKCHKPAEKISGCNLVVCVCGQPFCWLCGGATGTAHSWTQIDGHSCGRYKEEHEKKADRAKRDLNRYLHYYNRYKAHTDSLKLEAKLTETMQVKISTLESKDGSLSFDWLRNGHYRLFRSRKILSYTYPFAYYMFGDLYSDQMTKEERGVKQNLFEDQQQQLESKVENLSKNLEEQFDGYDVDQIKKMRNSVMDLSVIIDRLCHEMYKYIENDLLDSLGGHSIAPYGSKGVQRATEV